LEFVTPESVGRFMTEARRLTGDDIWDPDDLDS